MCWACYTPLSGDGPGPGSAQNRAAAAKDTEEDKKKIPPWQLGVIGVALLGGIFVGVRTMMPASSSDGEEGDPPTAVGTDSGGPAAPPGTPPGPGGMPSPGPSMTSSPGGVPAPQEAPYKIVVPPNPRQSVATMAIVPTDSGLSGTQAAALAAYTRRQYKGNTKKWSSFYIYVFSDAQSAQYFADYMKSRKGAPLSTSDYSYLSSLWGSVLTRYEYSTSNGKRVEKAVYPSKNPSGWWNERS